MIVGGSGSFSASASGDAFALAPAGIDVEALEKKFLDQAMGQGGKGQTKAATLLRMHFDTFPCKLKKHGLV